MGGGIEEAAWSYSSPPRRLRAASSPSPKKTPSPNKAFGKQRTGDWRLCNVHFERMGQRGRKHKQRHGGEDAPKEKERHSGEGKGKDDEGKEKMPVYCIVIVANSADEEDDVIFKALHSVLDGIGSAPEIDVWMPEVKEMKPWLKQKLVLNKWALPEWTTYQESSLSPLTLNNGMLRVITGLPDTNEAIRVLVTAGVKDWENAEKSRKFVFISVSGHGSAVGLLSACNVKLGNKKHEIRTFSVCEDVLDGVMDALNDCSDALRGFVPVIALDWCNSMQSVKNAGKKDWWEVLSLKTEIELIYLMGWVSSPSLKEGLQQFSWLANCNNLVDKEALEFLAAKSDTPVRVVELRKGKFVSERLFG